MGFLFLFFSFLLECVTIPYVRTWLCNGEGGGVFVFLPFTYCISVFNLLRKSLPSPFLRLSSFAAASPLLPIHWKSFPFFHCRPQAEREKNLYSSHHSDKRWNFEEEFRLLPSRGPPKREGGRSLSSLSFPFCPPSLFFPPLSNFAHRPTDRPACSSLSSSSPSSRHNFPPPPRLPCGFLSLRRLLFSFSHAGRQLTGAGRVFPLLSTSVGNKKRRGVSRRRHVAPSAREDRPRFPPPPLP